MSLLFLGQVVDSSHADAIAQARSLREIVKPESDVDRRQQRKFISDLKEFARSRADEGSAEYWAIIRANIGRHKSLLETSGERSLGSGVKTVFILSDNRTGRVSSPSTIESIKSYVDEIERGERIFGGVRTRPGEFDEVVSLARRKGDVFSSFCSGTYIAPQRVLTAAHCVCDADFDGPQDARPVVVFGNNVNKVDSITSAFVIEFHALKVANPGAWCAKLNANNEEDIPGRDVAIVAFAKNRIENATRQRAGTEKTQLPPVARIASYQLVFGMGLRELILVGFGYNEDNVLGEKRVTSTRVADKICSLDAAQQYGCSTGRETVAIDYMAKRDTCGGDSGGPAFIGDGRADYYLTGVTSRGAVAGGTCGAGGIYSLITPEIIRWLTDDHGIDLVTCNDFARCGTYP